MPCEHMSKTCNGEAVWWLTRVGILSVWNILVVSRMHLARPRIDAICRCAETANFMHAFVDTCPLGSQWLSVVCNDFGVSEVSWKLVTSSECVHNVNLLHSDPCHHHPDPAHNGCTYHQCWIVARYRQSVIVFQIGWCIWCFTHIPRPTPHSEA